MKGIQILGELRKTASTITTELFNVVRIKSLGEPKASIIDGVKDIKQPILFNSMRAKNIEGRLFSNTNRLHIDIKNASTQRQSGAAPNTLPILRYYQSKKLSESNHLIAVAAGVLTLYGMERTNVRADSNVSRQVTYLEYAKLANAAYHANPQKAEAYTAEGWTRVYHDYREANWGFGAALFKKDDNYVIVIRGTENLWDLAKDAAMILTQNPADQTELFFAKALDYINTHSSKNNDVGKINTLSGKDAEAAKELEKILTILNEPTASGLSLGQLLVFLTAIPLSAAITASTVSAIAPGFGTAGAAIGGTAALSVIIPMLSKQFDTSLVEKSNQLAECFKRLDAISKKNITATGHSLGATMVEICAVKFNIKCVTFESPGCAEILQKTYLKDPYEKYGNITGFLAGPNSINTLYSHIGNNYRLKLTHSALPGTSFVNGAAGTVSRVALWSGVILAIAAPFTGGATLPAAATALKIAAGSKAVEVGSGAIRNMTWALKQHSLANIIDTLKELPNGHATRFCVVSWPSFWENNFSARVLRGIQGLTPFYGVNRSLFNYDRDQEVDEVQIEAMPGYDVRDSFKNKFTKFGSQ